MYLLVDVPKQFFGVKFKLKKYHKKTNLIYCFDLNFYSFTINCASVNIFGELVKVTA